MYVDELQEGSDKIAKDDVVMNKYNANSKEWKAYEAFRDTNAKRKAAVKYSTLLRILRESKIQLFEETKEEVVLEFTDFRSYLLITWFSSNGLLLGLVTAGTMGRYFVGGIFGFLALYNVLRFAGSLIYLAKFITSWLFDGKRRVKAQETHRRRRKEVQAPAPVSALPAVAPSIASGDVKEIELQPAKPNEKPELAVADKKPDSPDVVLAAVSASVVAAASSATAIAVGASEVNPNAGIDLDDDLE
jgi:hypothetical protein